MAQATPETTVRCPGCGAAVPDLPGTPHPYLGAVTGCWEIFGEVLAREYVDYGYPRTTNRLTTDTYAVQHPGEPSRRSIQSVNGHLVGLHLVLERGLEGGVATRVMGAVLGHPEKLTWLVPPEPNGSITVLDVAKASAQDEHARRVERWARDVWAAWAAHHDRVRSLARELIG